MKNRGGGRAGVLAMTAAILAGCATSGTPEQITGIREQVDQLAAQRQRVNSAVQALTAPTLASGGPGATAGSSDVAVIAADPAAGAGSGAGDPAAATDHYRRGYALYHQGDLERAEEAFGRFLALAPAHPAAADARYWIGECYFGRGRYREAIGAWRQVAESDHYADRPDRAQLRIGAAFVAIGDLEMARASFRRVLDAWPDGDAAPAAREAIDSLPAS